MYAFLHKKLKVSTVVYQQCSSATVASFWKVGVRCWIERSDLKVRTMNKENARKLLIRMLSTRKLKDSAHFCSLYAFPEDYISKLKEM